MTFTRLNNIIIKNNHDYWGLTWYENDEFKASAVRNTGSAIGTYGYFAGRCL